MVAAVAGLRAQGASTERAYEKPNRTGTRGGAGHAETADLVLSRSMGLPARSDGTKDGNASSPFAALPRFAPALPKGHVAIRAGGRVKMPRLPPRYRWPTLPSRDSAATPLGAPGLAPPSDVIASQWPGPALASLGPRRSEGALRVGGTR